LPSLLKALRLPLSFLFLEIITPSMGYGASFYLEMNGTVQKDAEIVFGRLRKTLHELLKGRVGGLVSS